MTVGEVLNLQQWQQRVGVLRNTDPLIKRGRWQAFLNTTHADGTPIHGTYGVVRWELPSISIAHEDPDEVLRLARWVEGIAGIWRAYQFVAVSDELLAEVADTGWTPPMQAQIAKADDGTYEMTFRRLTQHEFSGEEPRS